MSMFLFDSSSVFRIIFVFVPLLNYICIVPCTIILSYDSILHFNTLKSSFLFVANKAEIKSSANLLC